MEGLFSDAFQLCHHTLNQNHVVSYQKRSHRTSLQLLSFVPGNNGHGGSLRAGCVDECAGPQSGEMGLQASYNNRHDSLTNTDGLSRALSRSEFYQPSNLCGMFRSGHWNLLKLRLALLLMRTKSLN